jgi:hypothetical protein
MLKKPSKTVEIGGRNARSIVKEGKDAQRLQLLTSGLMITCCN